MPHVRRRPGGHIAGMDQRHDYAELDARPPWFLRFLVRRALPVGLVLLGLGVIATLNVDYKQSDRYYATHKSIAQAEKLAKICHLRRGLDRQYPAKLADLPGMDARELTDGWGNPFRYAVVLNEAGEWEPHVWTERTDAEGRTTLIGAKAKADGTVVRFGMPPKD